MAENAGEVGSSFIEKFYEMAQHIIMRLRSSLLMQILLELNVYLTFVWIVRYLQILLINWNTVTKSTWIMYVLVSCLESLRLYAGKDLNLSLRGPRPKCFIFCSVVLNVPIWPMAYILSVSYWLNIWCLILGVWLLFLVLQMIVAVRMAYNRHGEPLPDWPLLNRFNVHRPRQRYPR